MARFVLTAATILALAASGADAFAFVARSGNALPSTYIHGANLVGSSSSSGRSVTALQMNLFDRFSRVAKSNLNNILNNLEDPEKIMNQAVEDMQVGTGIVV